MYQYPSRTNLLTIALCLLATPIIQAADKPEKALTNLVGTIAVPDGLSEAGVGKAIINAALGRRWKIKEKSDKQVVLHLVHRGFDSTITLIYNSNGIKIYSDSWTISKRGVKKKKKDPEGWINNLIKDLPVFMSRELYQ